MKSGWKISYGLFIDLIVIFAFCKNAFLFIRFVVYLQGRDYVCAFISPLLISTCTPLLYTYIHIHIYVYVCVPIQFTHIYSILATFLSTHVFQNNFISGHYPSLNGLL